MRNICAATDTFAATGNECATGRVGAGDFCHACAMGTRVFHNGEAGKRGGTREVARTDAILVDFAHLEI